MKKIFSTLLLLLATISLFGCGNSKESDNTDNKQNEVQEQQNKEQNKEYTMSDFENDVKNIIPNIESLKMAAEYVNAESGIKLKTDDSKLELYKYDKNSEAYKEAEKNQKLTMKSVGSFNAIVKNGYALMIDDDFPNKDKIEELFNKLT